MSDTMIICPKCKTMRETELKLITLVLGQTGIIIECLECGKLLYQNKIFIINKKKGVHNEL